MQLHLNIFGYMYVYVCECICVIVCLCMSMYFRSSLGCRYDVVGGLYATNVTQRDLILVFNSFFVRLPLRPSSSSSFLLPLRAYMRVDLAN